jgi:hypothetical protein
MAPPWEHEVLIVGVGKRVDHLNLGSSVRKSDRNPLEEGRCQTSESEDRAAEITIEKIGSVIVE